MNDIFPKRFCTVDDCTRRRRRNGLCDMHSQRMKCHGTTDDPVRLTPEQRFWAKVDRHGPDECWPWTAAVNEHGYGVFNATGRKAGPLVKAHRFSLELAGVDTADLVVRHSCDNPPCVNPTHLSVGSKADNTADMVARGRAPFGTRSGSAKLTDAAVTEIRARVAAGELHRVLAAEFGVHKATISDVARRRSWTHLPAHSGTETPS